MINVGADCFFASEITAKNNADAGKGEDAEERNFDSGKFLVWAPRETLLRLSCNCGRQFQVELLNIQAFAVTKKSAELTIFDSIVSFYFSN